MTPNEWLVAGISFALGVIAAFAISASFAAVLFLYRWRKHAHMAEERVWTGDTHS